MTDVEQVNEDLKNFTEGLKKLLETFEPLKKFESIAELEDKVALTDYAELNVSMAYNINSLYYMYMKLNGISTEEHKINGEIERIKEYFERIQQTITRERVRKNPHEVNTEAARRLIKAHLHDNEKEEMKKEEDLWQQEEPKVNKKIKLDAPKKATKIEDVKITKEDSDSEEEELEAEPKAKPKKGKKLHKGSLLASGGHISWKDEIEKMLK